MTDITDPRRFWSQRRTEQDYAIDQLRDSHHEALYAHGEYIAMVLLWHVEDHNRGLVGRCPTCYVAWGKTADAYGQPAEHRCPDCYGTTFEGGYKAIVYRPSLWDFNEPEHRAAKRGEVISNAASVQVPSDVRFRIGDYILRGDGTRWAVKTITASHPRPGFGLPGAERTAIGFNHGQVGLEDRSAVVYDIPPDETTLIERLDHIEHRPLDFSEFEEIRGPLL